MACGLSALILAMSRPSWKPGRRHGTQTTRSPKIWLVSCFTVGGGSDRDPAIGMQVIDVRSVDEAVHRGIDRRRRTAPAVQAVVEGRDHLVFALHAGIDVDQRAHPVQAQHGEPGLGQRAEIAAGTLDPEQLDVVTGDGIGLGALGRRVASGVVGVLRIGSEPVGPGDQLGDCCVSVMGSLRRPSRPGCRRRVRRRSASW